MKLKEIAIGYIDIPLVTPFKTALRTVNSVNDLIVKVTAEDGTEGYGEAPPTAVITGDTKESIEAAIRYYIAPTIKGMDLEDLPAIMQKLEKCLAKNTTAKAAVDIALYDLYAKLQKKPLFRLLGKGGAKDVERIREIRNAVGKDIVIRVDANQGWTREEAVSTITAMEDAGLGIELVEQPVSYHDFKGMQYVTAQVETPILADESVFSNEDAVRLMEEKGADLINIKLMKTGGIHEAVRICDAADQFGVKCMIGCMLESKVSVSAGVHLAAARSCVTMADLDGPSLCRIDPYEGGPVYEGPHIFLKEDNGIGITGVPVKFETI